MESSKNSVKLNINRSIGWNLEYATMEITQRIHNGANCYPWREVFVFWPVKTMSGKRVWFRKIYKQRLWIVWGTGFHMEPCVEYAELFDIMGQLNGDNS